ncbi:uncharacterized protein LOC127802182 [Diospyros lotus]|uniref:uncharacterized protein LOC127802182 n=1 Tax=Diospyros lotus TaxID=55363 RepID=UPI00224FD9F9|nr:uncharacterized protein LOC127802182 [Diospyros lotus]
MWSATDMILNLTELYAEQSSTAWYEILKQLFWSKMLEGTNVRDHVLAMVDLINQLEVLDFHMDADLQINLILQSFLMSFSEFIMNLNMNKILWTLSELLNMLRTD